MKVCGETYLKYDLVYVFTHYNPFK
ncbi:protein of unknown function (plasmid) [Cupriavidus taiwanensis]|uniref:Uncharacterized protein n=1 Tax=Cupriavidus taiwanensis TaxID=164546 RepID=A0A7Z7NRN6_9BURK|nr:hypothetical protein CBM2598_U30058 [Cupriavidus taiwanensis]SPC25925.1 hypothetical protein CBM2594_U20112 [Cupriavidus taiwanensis]SPD38049.1 protein of unknown function [Cupriavidus taiwanensis]